MKKLIVLCLTVVLLGCSATTGNLKLESSSEDIRGQMAPLANKADVRQKFGTPNLIFEKNGLEYYEYKNVSGHGRYEWLFPILGWMISWFEDTYVYTETNLFVGFNKAGEIKDWNVVQTKGTYN